MQIRSITIGAQRKLPHPTVEYAHISGMANITANLGSDDDFAECCETLQRLADAAVDQHLAETTERLKTVPRQVSALKSAAATAAKAAALAAKHGGEW